MYNVHIYADYAGPADLRVQVRPQVLTEIKVNPALFKRLVLPREPHFFNLPTALLLMRAAGNNGWLCGVLQ